MPRNANVGPGEDADILVRLRNLSKSFGDMIAVHPLNLDIAKGDFVALLGPSGCGKTTLLRMIGGFLEPTTGSVEIAGQDVTRLGPEKRNTNMVFQGYGLFPHMTVRQNISYGLRLAKRPAREIDERVSRIIKLVHLDLFEDRRPAALSGGQQQRVALARALIMEPEVLLLDECLSALDLKLRKAMQDELRELHRALGGTFVFVTHDQGEAMALANRIVVMHDGRIIQSGTPHDVYDRPATQFVAGFIGDANILRGRRSNGRIVLSLGIEFDDPGDDGDIVVVVRPDDIVLTTAATETGIEGRIADKTYLGPFIRYRIATPAGEEIIVHQTNRGAGDAGPGETVRFGWDPSAQRIVKAE